MILVRETHRILATESSHFFGSFVVWVDRLGSLVAVFVWVDRLGSLVAGFVWVALVTGSVFVRRLCAVWLIV